MTAHVLVQLRIDDRDAFTRYRDVAGEALSRHGASVVNAGPVTEVLDPGDATPDVVAMIAFPSVDAVRAWRSDPELADVHALRNKAGACTIFVMPAAA